MFDNIILLSVRLLINSVGFSLLTLSLEPLESPQLGLTKQFIWILNIMKYDPAFNLAPEMMQVWEICHVKKKKMYGR